jgi:hypothetical protein
MYLITLQGYKTLKIKEIRKFERWPLKGDGKAVHCEFPPIRGFPELNKIIPRWSFNIRAGA